MSDSTLAVIEPRAPSTVELIAGVIKGGINAENVGALERLVALHERQEARESERLFAEAFADLQSEMPKIEASKIVPGNTPGSVRYTYAPYEEIMRKAQPILAAHGFAVTFDTKVDEARVNVTCTLIHRGGHSRSNQFAARIGKGPPGSSEAQGDGAATTYAKRFALCGALNIIVETDSDAALGDGGTITPAQAEALRQRALDCKADIPRFMKFLKVDSFDAILAKDYSKADHALTLKESQK